MENGILLSRNLVYQLVDDEKSKKKKKSKPKIPKESQQSQKKAHQKQTPNESEIPKGSPAPGWAVQTPFYVPTPPPPPPPPPPSSNPELESIRSVLKESENVLEKLQTHEETMLKKVAERAKELHEKEFKLPQQKIIICQPEKDACLACYKEHLKDPLKCAPLVSMYQDCVRRGRKQTQVPS